MSHPIIKNGAKYWVQDGKPHREDGPAVIDADGTESWFRHGKYHRNGGPALIYPDGAEYWYQNGELDRVDGPAVTYPDGNKHWYLNNRRIRDWKRFQLRSGISDEELMVLVLKYGNIT